MLLPSHRKGSTSWFGASLHNTTCPLLWPLKKHYLQRAGRWWQTRRTIGSPYPMNTRLTIKLSSIPQESTWRQRQSTTRGGHIEEVWGYGLGETDIVASVEGREQWLPEQWEKQQQQQGSTEGKHFPGAIGSESKKGWISSVLTSSA